MSDYENKSLFRIVLLVELELASKLASPCFEVPPQKADIIFPGRKGAKPIDGSGPFDVDLFGLGSSAGFRSDFISVG